MAVQRVEIDVEATPAEVWTVMADVERWPRWTASVRAAAPLTDGPLRVGAKYRLRQPRLPSVVWTVDSCVPDRSFSWTAASPGVASRGVHSVEASDGRSHVLLTFEQTGPLAGVSTAVYARLIRRYVRMEAEGLKRHVEAGRPRGG